VRTLEVILTEDLSAAPARPSAADYEVAEHVIFWLGQIDGQRFLQQCQAEVKALGRIESYRAFSRIGRQDNAMTDEIRSEFASLASTGKVAAAEIDDIERSKQGAVH
jgi:hypothetical protein